MLVNTDSGKATRGWAHGLTKRNPGRGKLRRLVKPGRKKRLASKLSTPTRLPAMSAWSSAIAS